MTRLVFLAAFILAAASAGAASIDRATMAKVYAIGDAEGVPRSVVLALQLYESGDRKTGELGDPARLSRYKSRGYHSMGLYQLYARPADLAYLVKRFWYRRGATAPFEIFDPIHNATVALRYLADLHDRFGNWTQALWFYNCGQWRRDLVPEETIAYAEWITAQPERPL